MTFKSVRNHAQLRDIRRTMPPNEELYFNAEGLNIKFD